MLEEIRARLETDRAEQHARADIAFLVWTVDRLEQEKKVLTEENTRLRKFILEHLRDGRDIETLT